MIAVKVICVGKLKEAFYQQACAEYEKRLKGFCRLEVVELPEDTRPGNLAREAEKIRQAIPQGSYTVALCIEGTELSSEALSKKLAQLASAGASQLTFLIGGSFGLHPRVKQRADLRLSMSPMTFPHHLARVMLLEQLYRAYQIDAGTRYHK